MSISVNKDWFDYLISIFTMLGSIATLCAFIYLFHKDINKQKQIDSLTKLALVSEEQLMLSIMPDLYKNGGVSNGPGGEISVDLLNRGGNARLLEFNSNSPGIQLHNQQLPYDLIKNGGRKIFLRSTNQNANFVEYEISVNYEDKLKNLYQIIIRGKGANVTFDQPQLIKNRSER